MAKPGSEVTVSIVIKNAVNNYYGQLEKELQQALKESGLSLPEFMRQYILEENGSMIKVSENDPSAFVLEWTYRIRLKTPEELAQHDKEQADGNG